jgi:protein tyrosine/serine phosphatase
MFASRLLFALSLSSVPVFAASAPGIKNFDRIDAHVYRGGQPTGEGFQYLAGLGIKTIIDLRETGDRSIAEERLVTGAGMSYVNVPMTGLEPPTELEINKILALLEDSTSGPVFVHCLRGADRTGVVIGAYHINHDKWDNVRALKDAKSHGMSFFQLPRQNYIKNFQPHSLAAKTMPKADPATAIPAAIAIPAASALSH